MKRILLASALLTSAALFAAACSTPTETASAPAPVQTAAVAAPAARPAPAIPAAQPAPAVTPAPIPAPQPQPNPIVRTDYSKTENWLCRPGLSSNPCEVNIDATIVKADGSMSVEKFKHDPNAPIDCFYVYPTVSLDPYSQSDLIPGPEEFNVVKTQLARFGAKCKLYAPMYRQFSLGALRAGRGTGGAVPQRGNRADANNDVDDAWAYYLANDNKGRGVVILGHSQGSGQITRLIAAKVDGKPAQDKLVSAIIIGSAVQVPAGKDVGGSFKSIPVCRKADQFGCVISYSSFRDTVPPSATASFGRGREGSEAICTNPAALGGGAAKNPKVYFSSADKEWIKGQRVTTPFVTLPGMTTTECVKQGDHHYLQVHFNADAKDQRIDDPGTDVMAQDKPDPSWGLHLMDANLGIGDLVDIVAKQGAAWKKKHP